MPLRLLLLAAVPVVAVLAACGSGTGVAQCSGEVQGKVNGTFSVCNELDQRYLQNLNEFSLTARFTELPTSFVLNAEWQLRGEPDDRDYTQDLPNVECKISVRKGTPEWLARKGAGLPASGTCGLTLAAVEANPQDGNVITYKSRGTMTARLEGVPGTGATEVVTLQMSFCQGDAAFCPPPPTP